MNTTDFNTTGSELADPTGSWTYSLAPSVHVRSHYNCGMEIQFIDVAGQSLEVLQLSGDEQLPALVFLHDGLGSVAQWRDVPLQLCNLLGVRGVVYSRVGHGFSTLMDAQSDSRGEPTPKEPSPNDFYQSALEVLPHLLERLRIRQPYLIGLGEGATIALLYAARYASAGLTAVAPTVCAPPALRAQIKLQVEPTPTIHMQLNAIHANAANVWQRWRALWAHPSMQGWQIASQLGSIGVPVLAIEHAYGGSGNVMPAESTNATRALPNEQIEFLMRYVGRCTVIRAHHASALEPLGNNNLMFNPTDSTLRAIASHYTDFAAALGL